mgnify:CR=1 FL=1
MTDSTTTADEMAHGNADDATDSGAKQAQTPDARSGLTEAERREIAALPYEQARDRLIAVVRSLETGGLNLDQSVRQWEIGEALAARAQGLLDDVRRRLDAAAAQQQSTADTAGTQSNLE